MLRTPSKDNFTGKKARGVFGLTAPVGIAISWGTGREDSSQSGTSHTIYVTGLDIGAVTAFRLRDQSSELPEFSWTNVVTLGVYYVYGIPSSPLSLGFGAQYGPQLRKIDLNDGSELNSKAWRASIFFVVDIPIFDLYTKGGN